MVENSHHSRFEKVLHQFDCEKNHKTMQIKTENCRQHVLKYSSINSMVPDIQNRKIMQVNGQKSSSQPF